MLAGQRPQGRDLQSHFIIFIIGSHGLFNVDIRQSQVSLRPEFVYAGQLLIHCPRPCSLHVLECLLGGLKPAPESGD